VAVGLVEATNVVGPRLIYLDFGLALLPAKSASSLFPEPSSS